MNRTKAIAWLYSELPELIRGSVLSEEASQALRRYYGDVHVRDRSSIALIVFSVVGATFIGLGIILMLAYNWEELSRPSRTVLSLGLLLVAQGCAGYTLLERRRSLAWREGTATFLMLSIGASIALISQTYQIQGDLGNFLLVWMVLTIPTFYLLDAVVPAALYMVGITIWSGYVQSQHGHALWFWVLFAALALYSIRPVLKDSTTPRAILMAWTGSLGLTIALGITLEKSLAGSWIMVYAAYFSVLYLVGTRWLTHGDSLWLKPLTFTGAVGTVVLSLMLSFEEFWSEVGWTHYRTQEGYYQWVSVVDYLLLAVLLSIAMPLFVAACRLREEDRIAFGFLPILAIVCYGLAGVGYPTLFPKLLFNAYLFGLAVLIISRGLRIMALRVTNAGLLILTSLIVARFFDSGLGFIERGIGFILIGIGFLATNFLLVRKRKAA